MKTLFMPMIYGKTFFSMVFDIQQAYGPLLSSKDTYIHVKMINQFFSNKYPNILNLMKLITLVRWFTSKTDKALLKFF